jgi:hypothetical protein
MIPLSVELNHYYSVLEVGGNKQGIDDAYNWCLETFGPPGHRWFYRPGKFYFKNNKDYMWFELRW